MRFTTSHAAALIVASTALVGGGIAVANAADDSGSSSGSSATTDASGRAECGRGASDDTPVTGAEKTKVVDAVEAAHEGVTITDVREDPDGSYDALGTDADDNPVFYDVSADLDTITEHPGGPGRHGGRDGEKGDRGELPAPSEPASPSTTS